MTQEKFPGMNTAINRVLGEDLEELKVPGELFQGSVPVEVLKNVDLTVSHGLMRELGGPVMDHISKFPADEQPVWMEAATVLFLSLPLDMWPTPKALEMLVKTHDMLVARAAPI